MAEQFSGLSIPQELIDSAIRARGGTPRKSSPFDFLQEQTKSTKTSGSVGGLAAALTELMRRDAEGQRAIESAMRESVSNSLASQIGERAAENTRETANLIQGTATGGPGIELETPFEGGFGEPSFGAGIDEQLKALQSGLVQQNIPKMTSEERAQQELDEIITSDEGQAQQKQDEIITSDATTTVTKNELGAAGPDGFPGAEETSKKETRGYDEVSTKDKESTNVAEAGFSSGVKAYLDALTGEDTGVKDLDEYKKEFAKATGINISGKPDKSSALMAFGLALMQNRAGKGFNVGRMLSALGEAGEKAMPAFEKAKAAAKAEQLAAGKYALDARGAALTRAAATRKAIADRIAELSDKAYDRETQMQVQQLKGEQELAKQELIKEASLLKNEIEAQAKAGELGEPKKINLGGTGDEAFDIQVQQQGKSGKFKIIAPQAAMDRINKKIQSADAGLKTVNKMQDLSSGGQTVGYEGIYTRMSDAFKGLFSIPAVEKGSNVEQYRAAVGKMLVRYRKLLTGGEAGNAISDRDVAIIRQNLGLPEGATEIAFTSAAQVGEYLSSLEELFTDRKALFVSQKGALVEFGQSSGYYSEEAKDDDYSDDYLGYVPQVVGGKLRLTLPK